MRPLTLDRPALTTLRTGLVLMIAFMLVLTRLPLAQAQDETGTDDATVDTEQTEEFSLNPPDETGAPTEPPADSAGEPTDAPADDGSEPPADAAATDDGTTEAAEDGPAEARQQSTEGSDTEESDTEESISAAAEDDVVAAALTGGDFVRPDWVAAHPSTYNHVLGTGGIYGSGGNATTVESLNSGDFRCGEQVVYFLRMEADSGTSGGSTVDITTTFEGLTTGQPGIGHERIISVSLQEQSGGDGVNLAGWSQSGAGSTQVVGNVTLGDFDAGETVIVRYQVRLGCPTGSPTGGTGVIHANLAAAQVTSPTISVINTGSQTIPFKQSGSIPRSDLTITKVVSGSPRGNPTYTVTVACGLGITETLTFTGSGTQTVAQVPQTDTCQVSETNNGGADQTTVSVNGGPAQNATTASITIGAGQNNVTFTNTFLAPDVSVTKTASPTSVTPGGTITYTIVATNAASANTPATGVVVSDNLDDDLANVAATYQVSGGGASGSCAVGAGNTISCPAVTLNVGQSVTVTVTARATVASCGQVLNRAQAVGTNFSVVQSPQVTVNVNCAPDITVVKSASSNSVVPGEELTYTITATNPSTATAAATGVVISDDLADSLTGVSATVKVGADPAQACTIGAGNTVSCTVGTLDIGEAAVVTIKATPTPASCPSVSNRATVTGSNFADEQSNQVNVTVVCTPDLTITKAATATNVVPGDDWEYRITVTSPASATAPSNNVVITDNLHDGLNVTRPTYTITGTAGSQNCDAVGAGNTIRCAVGTVQPGQTVVVTIPVEATTQSCGPLQNVATVAASNIANPKGSNQVTVTVTCAPALQLTKAASTGTVAAGGPITYTITATNPANATAPAEDVVITDNLDDDLMVTAANVVKGGATQACAVGAGNTITCNAGDIAIGQTATVTISVTTTEAACGQVVNTSTANGSNFTTVTSNQVSVTVTCTPGLTLVKSSSTGTVTPGQAFTYAITATNAANANATARDIVVTDNLHDGLSGVSATFRVGAGAPQACDPTGAGNTIRCAIGNLAPGASAVVTIAATATGAACGAVRNTSSAVGSNFTTVTSNEVLVNVTCVPGLTLAKSASTGSVIPGQAYTYAITAANSMTATSSATGVVITDNLDDDLSGVAASFRVGTGAVQACDATGAGNTIRCAVGTLAAGESAVVTITATATAAACGAVRNTSTANGTNFTTVTSNEVLVNVVCNPGMSIAKTASSSLVQPGQTFTYTITATNGPTATQAANGVVITDNLDDRLTGVAATYRLGAGPVTSCDPTGAGNTIRCAVGNLAAGASAIVSISATAPVAGNCAAPLRNVSTAVGTNFTTVTSNEVVVNLPCVTTGPNPAIEVVKTGVAPVRDVGDPITYTYVITNRGDVTLTGVTLDDDKLGSITLTTTTLTPGQSTTATATHIITTANVIAGTLTNVATTTGKTPSGGEVRDTDDETITIPGAPEIRITKTPNLEVARVGDTVTYTYVIRNTGTTRLTDVTLVDDKIGTIIGVEDRVVLEIGQSLTVTADYLVTEDDVARGTEVVNIATVSGLPPTGPAVQAVVEARVGTERVLNTGVLRVVKQIGTGAPAEGAEFGFSVDCGTFSLGPADAFTLPEDGGRHDVGVLIPEGQVCQVTETRTAGAMATTVAVNDGPARNGTSTAVTIEVPDVPPGVTPPPTVVTFVNSFDRPIVPPQEPPPETPPPLPATGSNLVIQLLLGMAALALGASMVRRFQPDTGVAAPARRRKGFFTA